MNSTPPEQSIAQSRAPRWIGCGILLLAGFLRLARLDLISVTNETALQQLTASAAMSLKGINWPLAGPPTEPVRSSAFLVTGIALANLAWNSPVAGNVFVIALNLGAVALLYRLCLRQYGFHAAWMAALLYAVSPWGVLYSRYLLSCSCLAIFSLLLIHLALRWLQEPGGGSLAIMVLLAFVIPQIHFTGIWVPLWLVVVLFLGRRKISWSGVAVGGGLAALAWTPWISFQQMTGWNELTTWKLQMTQSSLSIGSSLVRSIEHLIDLLHSSGFDYWFGSGATAQSPEFFPAWLRWSAAVSAVLLTAALIAAVIWSVAATSDRSSRLLLLWLALSVFCGSLLRTGGTPDNMLIAYPVPLILVGAILGRLRDRLPRRLHSAPTAAVLAVSVIHIALLARGAQLADAGTLPAVGQYQLCYRDRQQTLRSVLDDAVTGPVRIAGSASGWYPAYEYLLLYESPLVDNRIESGESLFCYWIDEESAAADVDESVWNSRKERQINPTLSEALRTPPDWEIERHWTVGRSQIYRVRLVNKQPLS